ncbi:hypothetical protein BDZ91DRAFT_793760 [Kalaharituber pfeilii]|nr:hypothetical protein BDZ91DRAFT_793760 [Kalaharituber pfeilii]
MVYDLVVRHLEIEGYPSEAISDFKEANVNDLVYAILNSMMSDFRRKIECKVRLSREKEVVAVDAATGDPEEFAVMDWVSVKDKKYVLIMEPKRTSIGMVYGFVAMGEHWQILRYDCIAFVQMENLPVLFRNMGCEEERWMTHFSMLVDLMNCALSSGGLHRRMWLSKDRGVS